MNELALVLVGDSAAAPAANILEGLTEDLVHRGTPGAPHSIYAELWHLAFWQQMTLDWVHDRETPYPLDPAFGFPSRDDEVRESWDELRRRFLDGAREAAELTDDRERMEQTVRCTSRPGHPVRLMSVREQVESLAAHNAYHLGRIVLLRQINGAWPPASGGFG